MPHPDHVVAVDDTKGGTAKLPLLEPIYPLTAGLTNTSLRKSIAEALTRLPALPEWIDKAWREQNAWPSFADALCRMHAPESAADLETAAPARMRLAYDELLANQLALAVIRQRLAAQRGTSPHLSRQAPPGHPLQAPIQAHRCASPRARRDRRGSRQPLPHAPPAARRCRQRQDSGGTARHGDRGRGWSPGGVHGADRAPGAPAPQDD